MIIYKLYLILLYSRAVGPWKILHISFSKSYLNLFSSLRSIELLFHAPLGSGIVYLPLFLAVLSQQNLDFVVRTSIQRLLHLQHQASLL